MARKVTWTEERRGVRKAKNIFIARNGQIALAKRLISKYFALTLALHVMYSVWVSGGNNL